MPDISTFSDLSLAEPILRALEREGLTEPTPIQRQAIPHLLAGRDVLGVAQTGTGKTAAFALPILDRLVRERRNSDKRRGKSVRVLVLSPTRELTQQIAEAIRTFGRFTSPRSAVVVGGVRPGPQVKAMAAGLDILVATPGRLEDHMRGGAVRLDDVGVVVLDEADQMLDLGFAPAIRRILAKTPTDRQTLLFSATMPKAIRQLANDYLDDPVEVSVTPQATTVERIEQSVVHVGQKEKRHALAHILSDRSVSRAIVFVRTKRGADRVGKQLGQAGIKANVIHGDKGQGQRQRALAELESGQTPILIATDIAARGIDVGGITHVVNHDLPHVPEAYVHRIGRTARAGASGRAISLVNSDEGKLLRDIERLIKMKVPEHPPIEGVRAPAPAPVAEEYQEGAPSRKKRPRGKGPGRKGPGRQGSGRRGPGQQGPRAGEAAREVAGGGDSKPKRSAKRRPKGKPAAKRDGAERASGGGDGRDARAPSPDRGAPRRRTGRPGRKSRG